MLSVERKGAALAAMGENFGKPLTPRLAEMWLRLLEPYTPEEVERAALAVIRTYKFKTIPPFAILAEHLPQREEAALGEGDAKEAMALAEWSRLLDDISAHGWQDCPAMHPTTAFVVRGMGGWGAACRWKEDELQWRRKEFLEAWTRSDGHVDLMAGGAVAIEERRRAMLEASGLQSGGLRKVGGRKALEALKEGA